MAFHTVHRFCELFAIYMHTHTQFICHVTEMTISHSTGRYDVAVTAAIGWIVLSTYLIQAPLMNKQMPMTKL